MIAWNCASFCLCPPSSSNVVTPPAAFTLCLWLRTKADAGGVVGHSAAGASRDFAVFVRPGGLLSVFILGVTVDTNVTLGDGAVFAAQFHAAASIK